MKKLWRRNFLLFLALFAASTYTVVNAQNIETCSRKSDLEGIKACLAKGADPNYKWDKQTLLAHSFTDTTHQITRLLVAAKGIKINEWNIEPMPEVSWKYTALMRAVEYPDMVTLLIEKGANLNLQDDWLKWDGMPAESGGNTPLMLSVKDYTTSARILIEKGANLNLQNRSGYTALMIAVENTEVARLLIEKGANMELLSKGGETALMLAAIKSPEVVKLLIDKGANLLPRQQPQYKSSQNALDYAALHGNMEAAKLILARATTLGIKKEIIRVSLHWAVIGNQLEMARYLLSEGAYIEGDDDLGGYTPLMETSSLEMVQLLIKNGANVNAKNKFNYTPLHKAVFNFMGADPDEKQCEKILNLLLEKGADIDAQDGNGITPLMGAVQKPKVAKLLINKGAKLDIQNTNGETALMYAVKGGLLKVVLMIPVVGASIESTKLLVNKGADVNIQDKWGKTALMHAAGGVNAQGNKYGTYTDVLELLLDKGAQLELKDKEGHTALYWAYRYNRTKSGEILLARGANPAQKYDKKTDKSNVKAGIVGTWTNSAKYLDPTNTVKKSYITLTNKVVFKADWSYSKTQTANGQVIPDGAGYNSYELRDGRIWLFNNFGTNAVIEFRFEGSTLILNGEKYTKAAK